MGQLSSFPNFDLLPGTLPHGQLGVFSLPSVPQHGHRDVRRRLYLLSIRGSTWGEGKPGIKLGSPDPQSSQLPLHHRSGQWTWKLHSNSAIYIRYWCVRARPPSTHFLKLWNYKLQFLLSLTGFHSTSQMYSSHNEDREESHPVWVKLKFGPYGKLF